MQADHITMAPNGRMVIPAVVRDKLGMKSGGTFVVHVENGEIRLEPIDHAIARVQALVAQYVSVGRSLEAELSAERRTEAERE